MPSGEIPLELPLIVRIGVKYTVYCVCSTLLSSALLRLSSSRKKGEWHDVDSRSVSRTENSLPLRYVLTLARRNPEPTPALAASKRVVQLQERRSPFKMNALSPS
jgi:hypothetical protein